MENNKFVTETDSEYYKIQFYKTTIKGFWIMSILACLGFIVGWETFLFFEAIALSSCVFVFAQNKNKGHHWRLEFENNELIVTNLETKDSYRVWDTPISHFVINQTKKEAELDYCSVMIKHTIFMFGGVKKCKQLREYVEKNYK